MEIIIKEKKTMRVNSLYRMKLNSLHCEQKAGEYELKERDRGGR